MGDELYTRLAGAQEGAEASTWFVRTSCFAQHPKKLEDVVVDWAGKPFDWGQLLQLQQAWQRWPPCHHRVQQAQAGQAWAHCLEPAHRPCLKE